MGQWPCHSLFCQARLPVRWLWGAATRSLFKYCTYNTKIHWCSVDAHFQNGAGSMRLLFLTWKAANASFKNGCNQSPLRLPKMHSQKSLMLHWRSFSECSDHVVYFFDTKHCQYVGYEWHQPRHHSITLLTRLKIVDAPLMLILMYGLVKICCN